MQSNPVAGKVTIGLASHWPCMSDLVIYPPPCWKATKREMSTPICYYRNMVPYYFLLVLRLALVFMCIISGLFLARLSVPVQLIAWNRSYLKLLVVYRVVFQNVERWFMIKVVIIRAWAFSLSYVPSSVNIVDLLNQQQSHRASCNSRMHIQPLLATCLYWSSAE